MECLHIKHGVLKSARKTLHDSSRSIRRDTNFPRGVGDSSKTMKREGDAFVCACVYVCVRVYRYVCVCGRACVIARSSRSSA